jgi:WYL_2, Sm-like SH3 beta-barrel fold
MNNPQYCTTQFQAGICSQLAEGILELTFTKSDGSVRHMRATLNPALIPPQNFSSRTDAQPQQVQVVWDTQAQSWRSFRWDRLIQIVNAAPVADQSESGHENSAHPMPDK